MHNEKLVRYQTAPKVDTVNGGRSHSSAKKPMNLDVCENLDKRIEHEALECLERSEKRKKYLESRKKLSRNIISLENSSLSYN